MKLLVNFATPNFFKAQQFNHQTALGIGGFDQVFCANPHLIDAQFKQKHQSILNEARGAGYWLWKPYFILQKLKQLAYGDRLMYADSASHFISSAAPLFSLSAQFNQDVIPFELELPESAWTKRDTFIALDADEKGYELSPQRLASFILLRKSTMSLQFCQDYLNYCTNEQALTDTTNIYGKPNYDNFESHRHDQSIFSLLTKKYGLQAFRDPSQWGNNRKHLYTNSDYPQIIEHTRQKNPKQAKLSYKIKRFFFPKK
jgi:hypothetical protein